MFAYSLLIKWIESNDYMQRFIENMPKAELHVHIEGTLEPEFNFVLLR